jgi:hypothetical protein
MKLLKNKKCKRFTNVHLTVGFIFMITTYKQLRQAVVDVLNETVLMKIIKSVKFPAETIWGSSQPRKASTAIILITIYKDIQGIGYNSLKKEIEPYWQMSNEAIQRNIKLVRKELRNWANTIIIPEDVNRLSRLAIRANRPIPCENVSLWVDSTDFRIKGKRSLHKEKSKYAKKLKSPGRRWLTICNVRGQTQWISPPHLPTAYDSHILSRYSTSIESSFPRTTMIGDNHFRMAASAFITITLITPVSRAGRRKKVDGVMVPRQLSQEDEKINEVISLVRGKIEAPYGWVKQRFSALSQPFYEDEEQHDCLVRFAFACHRLMV